MKSAFEIFGLGFTQGRVSPFVKKNKTVFNAAEYGQFTDMLCATGQNRDR
jgi:hypothetical protein